MSATSQLCDRGQVTSLSFSFFTYRTRIIPTSRCGSGQANGCEALCKGPGDWGGWGAAP